MSAINILGTRGVPACHGGFETFAERLALYLRDRGHQVTVYCQNDDGPGGHLHEDTWQGLRRVHYAPKRKGALGTMEFDLACVRDVIKRPGVDLVLGYNTAVFNLLERLHGRCVVMNMDGIEWKRSKWSLPIKLWFWFNEIIGANLCSVAVADHPRIADHVARRCLKTPVMIPYGSDVIETAPEAPVRALGLEPGRYLISIARIEPENSILELLQAFEKLAKTHPGVRCVVLGALDADQAYHQEVRAAACRAGAAVLLPGAIYDSNIVQALRFHAAAYLHGHQVGGTNPSLVEALGAGNPVIAHDNPFNRWTAGEDQVFFETPDDALQHMERIFSDPDARLAMANASRARHAKAFEWNSILADYERVLFE